MKAQRIIEERPDYRLFSNNCQNFAQYLINAICSDVSCPETIASLLDRLFVPSGDEQVLRIPGTYPPSLASLSMDTCSFHTALDELPDDVLGEFVVGEISRQTDELASCSKYINDARESSLDEPIHLGEAQDTSEEADKLLNSLPNQRRVELQPDRGGRPPSIASNDSASRPTLIDVLRVCDITEYLSIYDLRRLSCVSVTVRHAVREQVYVFSRHAPSATSKHASAQRLEAKGLS